MAKGQHLSKSQQSIVRRFYEHQDSRTIQTLQEIVSDLFLAADAKAADRLWKRAATHLANSGLTPEAVAALVQGRDVKALGVAVERLARPGK